MGHWSKIFWMWHNLLGLRFGCSNYCKLAPLHDRIVFQRDIVQNLKSLLSQTHRAQILDILHVELSSGPLLWLFKMFKKTYKVFFFVLWGTELRYIAMSSGHLSKFIAPDVYLERCRWSIHSHHGPLVFSLSRTTLCISTVGTSIISKRILDLPVDKQSESWLTYSSELS